MALPSSSSKHPFSPTLSTPRLTLELLNSSPQHYTCIISCFNTPNALKYLGDRDVHTPDDIDKLLAGSMLPWKLFGPDYESNRTGCVSQTCLYLIHPKANHPGADRLVGCVALTNNNGDDDDTTPPDSGCLLLEEYQKYGYATEAAAELLRYVREELGVRGVVAWVKNPENVGSGRVAERIGMVKGGEVRDEKTGKMKVLYVLEGMRWRLFSSGEGLENGDRAQMV